MRLGGERPRGKSPTLSRRSLVDTGSPRGYDARARRVVVGGAAKGSGSLRPAGDLHGTGVVAGECPLVEARHRGAARGGPSRGRSHSCRPYSTASLASGAECPSPSFDSVSLWWRCSSPSSSPPVATTPRPPMPVRPSHSETSTSPPP